MNKFKLWLNRNDFNILIIVIIILMGYISLKSLGSSYERDNNKIEQKQENTYLNNSEIDSNITIDNFKQLDRSLDESQDVILIVQKIINTIYQANITNDNLSLRQDIYNILSEKMIQDLLNEGNSIGVDSVLNYIFYVDNISNYAIGNIYKCKENNNISKYAIVLRHKIDENNMSDNYFILNIDYNNHTFSYDGIVNELSEVDISGELKEIKNKNSNTF